jgi:RND family efflux transporter MFP subunit
MTNPILRRTPLHRLLVAWLLTAAVLSGCKNDQTEATKSAGSSKPALTVSLTTPETIDWPKRLAANGDIAAWQESVISAEISNYRLTQVLVNVADSVQKGQLLARISSDTVAAELAQTRAAVAEAEAALSEAKANAERALRLQESGFYSAQQGKQFLTGEQTAKARLDAARARAHTDELRLAQTHVLAPDDGVISARTATLGSLAQSGQELFRLIRGGRFEWRAEVTEANLGWIKPGGEATLTLPGGETIRGRVRAVAPTIDPKTRNGLVYVDLPPSKATRAGMFAQGEFGLGRAPALTLPATAVVSRDGFAYVFRLESADPQGLGKVAQVKVELDRRIGDRVEIVSGLAREARVVATGAGFLADGDTVQIVGNK